jgi:hypothetical protein
MSFTILVGSRGLPSSVFSTLGSPSDHRTNFRLTNATIETQTMFIVFVPILVDVLHHIGWIKTVKILIPFFLLAVSRTLVIVEGLDGNYRDEEANSCCCTKLERKARHYIIVFVPILVDVLHHIGWIKTVKILIPFFLLAVSSTHYRDEEANSCCCTKLERKARHYIRPRANWYLIQEHATITRVRSESTCLSSLSLSWWMSFTILVGSRL